MTEDIFIHIVDLRSSMLVRRKRWAFDVRVSSRHEVLIMSAREFQRYAAAHGIK